MRAIQIIAKGAPEKAFKEVTLETPEPGGDEVLIKVSHFGLNFADVMMRKGLYQAAPPIPYVPGYDVVGEVVKTGAAVEKVWVGKQVFALTRFGGYAEYAVTKAAGIGAVPKGMDPAAATALATQFSTALFCYKQCPNLRKGDQVLVHAAAGGVGIGLCQLALHDGLTAFGTAGSEEKLEFLKELGVQHPINYRTSDYKEEVLKITGKPALSASFNSIGGRSYRKDRKLLTTGGQHILFGGADRSSMNLGPLSTLAFVQRMGLLIPIALMMKSQGITGVNMLHIGDHRPDLLAECMQEVGRLAGEGVLTPHVHGVYSLNELNAAHLDLEKRKTIGKLVVTW